MRPPPLTPHTAVPCGIRPHGRRFFTHTVLAVQEGLHGGNLWRRTRTWQVIAESPAAAIDRIRKDWGQLDLLYHPVNWYSWGPRGGETYRFDGWESLIGREMLAARPTTRQLALF